MALRVALVVAALRIGPSTGGSPRPWPTSAADAAAAALAVRFSPTSLTKVGSSGTAPSHFWFPHVAAAFGPDKGTMLVSVRLADDSAQCVHPTCVGCSKIAPCKSGNTTTALLSGDSGLSWQRARTAQLQQASLNLGGVKLAADTYMVAPSFHRHGDGPVWGDSTDSRQIVRTARDNLTVRQAPSQTVTFTGIPAEISSEMTGLIRWCEVIALEGGGAAEIAQLEMPKSSPLGRSLAFFRTDNNLTFSFGGLIAAHRHSPFQNTSNGPCEAALAEVSVRGLSHPVLLAVFRVDSFADYYHTTSADNGLTWQPCTQLPKGMGSVRPRLRVFTTGPPGQEEQMVALVGGRPGLMLWVGSPAVVSSGTSGSPTTGGIRWAWSETNLALIQNELVALPSHRALRNTAYSAAWANRTVIGSFDLHESTAYTHLFAVPPPPPPPAPRSRSTASTEEGAVASFVLLFDRLAHGWAGPPGPDLKEDYVFAMGFQLH